MGIRIPEPTTYGVKSGEQCREGKGRRRIKQADLDKEYINLL